MRGDVTRGIVDTNILILRAAIDPRELPDELAISAVTLAELAAGVQLAGARSDDRMELARRLDVLQRAEDEFDPIPFEREAARAFGRIAAAVTSADRSHRNRVADLMIAATAVASGLPLYTTNPRDYRGLSQILDIRAVTRPDIIEG